MISDADCSRVYANYMSRIKYLLNRHFQYVLLVVGGMLLIINISIFYPGVMSADTVWQLRQAMGLSPLSDWHPASLALTWGGLIAITNKIGSMLVFQLTLLWASLTILSLIAYKKTKLKLLSSVVLSVGFLPVVVNISGTIWKDVLMAFSLMLSVSLSLLVRYSASRSRIYRNRKYILGLAVGLLVYAVTLRHNAVFALIPVAMLIMRVGYGVGRTLHVIVGAVAVVCVGLLMLIFIDKTGLVQESHVEAAVMLDDVVNIDDSFGYNNSPLMTSLKKIKQECTVKKVYMNSIWDCTDNSGREVLTQKEYTKLRSLWLNSILQNPIEYMSYRLYLFSIFLSSPRDRMYVFHEGIDKNEIVSARSENIWIQRIVRTYINDIALRYFEVIYTPLFWLTCSIGSLLLVRKSRLDKNIITAIKLLAASSLIYIVFYIPMVLATDYRYIYWPVCSQLIVAVLALIGMYSLKSSQKSDG